MPRTKKPEKLKHAIEVHFTALQFFDESCHGWESRTNGLCSYVFLRRSHENSQRLAYDFQSH